MFGISSKTNNPVSNSICINNIIEANNKKYNLKFYEDNKFLIIESLTEEFFPSSYKGKYSLKDIKKVKFFTDDYLSISEVLSEISETIEKKNITIKEKFNEIIIVIPLPSKKYPEIQFSLQVLKNDLQKLEETCNKMTRMNEEQKILKNENLKVQKEIEKIKKNQIKDKEDQDIIKKEQEKNKKFFENLNNIQGKLKEEVEKIKNEHIKDGINKEKIEKIQEKLNSELINIKDEIKKEFEKIKNEKSKEEKNETEKEDIKDNILNEQEKMKSELINLKIEMKNELEKIKNEKEKKISFLEDRINYLENFLFIKRNQEPINIECEGIYVECNTFDINDYYKYVFSNDDDMNKKEEEKYNFIATISFSFFCDKNDISNLKQIMQLAFKDFAEKIDNKENILSVYSNEDKIFIDFNIEDNKDKVQIQFIALFIIFLCSKLKIKLLTNFLPKNLFEKYDKVKIFRLIKDSKLLFDELTIKPIILSLLGVAFIDKPFEGELQIITDLLLSKLKGDLNYQISDVNLLGNKMVKEAFTEFREKCFQILCLLKPVKAQFNKINFEEIYMNLIWKNSKCGIAFKFLLPKINELIEELSDETIKKIKEEEKEEEDK